MTQVVVKNLRKAKMITKRMRQLSDEEILGQTVLTYQNMYHTLDFLIMAEESFWASQNRPSIFLESKDVAERLYKATYDVKHVEGIQMPFESFILNMPKDYKVDGTIIPGCLVTWMRFDEMAPRAVRPLCRKAGVPEPNQVQIPSEYAESMTIHISYRDPYNADKMMYGRCVVPRDVFKDLLTCRNLDEFREISGDYQEAFQNLIQSSEQDLVIQFTHLKIILAMAIYNQATDHKHLTPGLPGGQIQVDGMVRQLKPSHQTLRMPKLSRPSSTVRADHYRGFHFRQLRADRYYQGEYADKPRGSRWSFVSDAWVSSSGKDIDPYTQEFD